ncbi:MAG: lytic murein transglycosylase [Candidatus Latescibacterota bacterium]
MRKTWKICVLSAVIMLAGNGMGPAISEDGAAAKLCEKKYASLDSLVVLFEKKGMNIQRFLSDPKFQIYENIDSIFKNSAEALGADAYKEALKRGDEKEAERIFNEEYEKYKIKIGFEDKKAYINQFMEQYKSELSKAEKHYHIPAETIASIIGLESNFGKYIGKRQAFNVYVSLYVKNFRRGFALRQLEELLAFRKKTNKDIFDFTSSYAGAVGYMQFIPSSLNQWFVGDDVTDMEDTINSVANYLDHFLQKEGTMEKAVHRYNSSNLYVRVVLELAEYGKGKTGEEEEKNK